MKGHQCNDEVTGCCPKITGGYHGDLEATDGGDKVVYCCPNIPEAAGGCLDESETAKGGGKVVGCCTVVMEVSGGDKEVAGGGGRSLAADFDGGKV